jgi:hypothetical protein
MPGESESVLNPAAGKKRKSRTATFEDIQLAGDRKYPGWITCKNFFPIAKLYENWMDFGSFSCT